MKQLFLFLTVCFATVLVSAEELPVVPVDPPDTKKTDRIEIIIPNAVIEDGILTVKTELATWGVSVTISDENGDVVYSAYDTMESTIHEFAIGTLPTGGYTVEIQIGEDLFVGNFINN